MEIGLIIGVASIILAAQVFVIVKISALVKANNKLSESMQTLSDQLADVEERGVESQADVRKLTQYFVNFARGTKGGSGKDNWWNG